MFVKNNILVCIVRDKENLIAGTVNECITWTAWANSDKPVGVGDKETLVKDWWQQIGIQGRIEKTKQTVTMQKVQITLHGLKCLNENQIDKKCLDYEVRFCLEGNIQLTLDLRSNTIRKSGWLL